MSVSTPTRAKVVQGRLGCYFPPHKARGGGGEHHLVPYKRDGRVDTFVSSDRTECSHLCFGRDGRNSISRSTCKQNTYEFTCGHCETKLRMRIDTPRSQIIVKTACAECSRELCIIIPAYAK